jgi:hypothetical protein
MVSQGPSSAGIGLFFEARSGPQIRLKVDVTDQLRDETASSKTLKLAAPLQTGTDANVTAADDYLQSAPGMVNPLNVQSKLPPLKGIVSQVPPAGGPARPGGNLLAGRSTPPASNRAPVVPVGLGGPGDVTLLDKPGRGAKKSPAVQAAGISASQAKSAAPAKKPAKR